MMAEWRREKKIIYSNKVVHSTPYGFFPSHPGVLSTPSPTQFDPNNPLGSVIALRCIDPVIKSNLQKFSMIANTLNIPFATAGSRGLDARFPGNKIVREARLPAEDLLCLELFRAFRVYSRLAPEKPGKPEPISKQKGISCSNFVSYIYKAAIIAKFFPDGLPENLMKLFTNIETKRKAGDKKLDNIALRPLLKEFETEALLHLKERQAEMVHLNELMRPVKNANIKDFTYNALQSPLWMAGIYCFDESKCHDAIISHKVYGTAWQIAVENPEKIPRNSIDVDELKTATPVICKF
jgi:hypothetical protein